MRNTKQQILIILLKSSDHISQLTKTCVSCHFVLLISFKWRKLQLSNFITLKISHKNYACFYDKITYVKLSKYNQSIFKIFMFTEIQALHWMKYLETFANFFLIKTNYFPYLKHNLELVFFTTKNILLPGITKKIYLMGVRILQ